MPKYSAEEALKAAMKNGPLITSENLEESIQKGMIDKWYVNKMKCDFCEGRYISTPLPKHKAYDWHLTNDKGDEMFVCVDCFMKLFRSILVQKNCKTSNKKV